MLNKSTKASVGIVRDRLRNRFPFHTRRVSTAAVRIAVYSLVCGIFFIIGTQIGLHEIVKNSSSLREDRRFEERNFEMHHNNNDNENDPVQVPLVVSNTLEVPRTDNIEDNRVIEVPSEIKVVHEGGVDKQIPLPNKLNPGEMGKAFKPTPLTDELQQLIKEGWDRHAFNQYVSDQISVHRSLPDIRHSRCKTPGRYRPVSALPSTSVIICFHNEAWSTLLRTFHSVLNRSPPQLLTEIILVDDGSTQDHLKTQLVEYIKRFPKVKVLRTEGRVGLIKARLVGARAAKAETLTFLDSHCETTPGWLTPLLDRIATDPTNVVCPIIDIIDDDNFKYTYNRDPEDEVVHQIGIFEWDMSFDWRTMPEEQLKTYNDTSEPFASPTMAGGLFSINKAFFKRLGYYDPEFDIWGGENLELSFKTWMCGGRLEIVPCSHVGHIFRARSPYVWREGVNVAQRNSIRLVKVWVDEYAKYYLDRLGKDVQDYGDVSERLEIRRQNNCKSFGWYLKNICPFIYMPDRGFAHGEIRNLAHGAQYCLDSTMEAKNANSTIGMYLCHGQGSNQYFSYSKNLEIRRDSECMDFAGGKVVPFNCHGGKGNQEWGYDPETQHLFHAVYSKCLTMVTTSEISMEECQRNDERQKWNLQNFKEVLED